MKKSLLILLIIIAAIHVKFEKGVDCMFKSKRIKRLEKRIEALESKVNTKANIFIDGKFAGEIVAKEVAKGIETEKYKSMRARNFQ